MKKQFLLKLKEALTSVMPLSLIVVLLNFTPLVNLNTNEIIVFVISSLLLVLGIGLFTLGADLAMTPMGEHVGAGLTKSKSLSLLLLVAFALGFLVTVAEPDLTVLADQVATVIHPPLKLIVAVGVGVGVFLVVAIAKIVFKLQLSGVLMFFYMLLFALASLVMMNGNEELLPLAFDSGGVTTGPITVPFIMALGVGIAATVGGKNAAENSFGLIALCSVGPILAVMVLSIFVSGDLTYETTNHPIANTAQGVLGQFAGSFGGVAKDVAVALGLVVFFFFVINFLFLKLPKKKIVQILFGVLFTYLGLVIFLSTVHVGFTPVGQKVGEQLAAWGNPWILGIAGFVIGLVVVLAEPAVHVLTKQVEEITDGNISKTSMLIALCLGVGISICLSVLRIYFGFSVLYYLIPGYFISLGLSFFVPRMYTAIAFDSGGVASGPLTSTFILPFAIGACMSLGGNVLSGAFGVVAMVAMTPLITIQLLGFRAIVAKRVREKIVMRRILTEDDDQIIEF